MEGYVKTTVLCRKSGISEQAMYGGLNVGEAQQMRQLEDQNYRLKPLVG